MITKGAPDVLLSRLKKIETANGITDITDADLKKIEEVNGNFSKDGLRLLSFAYKEISARSSD